MRRPVGRELGEFVADLLEGQPDPLGEDDEGDPPEHAARVTAMARAGAVGVDQAALLVVAERRGSDAAAPRDLADGQFVVLHEHLTSSLLELVVCATPNAGGPYDRSQREDHRRSDELAGRRGRHRQRGEWGFTVGRKEIGHLHGDHAAHFGFPKEVWQELFDADRIDYHPVFPGRPGFGARAIESAEDEHDVLAMLRMNYDRVVAKHGVPAPSAG